MIELFDQIRRNLVGRDFELKAILAAIDAGKHILLEGPPGTSKSTLLRNIAKEAKVSFHIIEGNVDLTSAKILGHFNPASVLVDNYKPEYFDKGPLVQAMEEGGILYIEEFNRMPADVANVFITPMEEGEIFVPRYGNIHAKAGFTVVASQNPYDDVGTVRVSRAFMDRICLIKIDYQSENEEKDIVRWRTGSSDEWAIDLAVKLVRKTREHADIKLGASVRAAIDMVDVYGSLQKIENLPLQNLEVAAQMSLGNKIWLNETTTKTTEAIIEGLWKELRPYVKEPAIKKIAPEKPGDIPARVQEQKEEKKKTN